MGYTKSKGQLSTRALTSARMAQSSVLQQFRGIGLADDTTAATATPSLTDALDSDTVKTASAVALTYHGYRRTGSLIWALLYGAAGRFVPKVAVPVAIAQGFGKKRTCTTE